MPAQSRTSPAKRGRSGRSEGRYPSGFEARRAAVNALSAILRNQVPLDAALQDPAARDGLADRDRALVRLIVSTCLRRLPQIDALFSRLLKTPIDARGGMVREILVVGAAQILFLGSAPHAVVNIAVAQAAADRKGMKLKGLVNAVLRRIAENGEAMLADLDDARLVLPEWLRQRWNDTYGPDATLGMAALLLSEPPLDLTVKPGEDLDAWAGRLGGTVLPSGSIRLLRPGRVPELDGFNDGTWWVQDAAAALPARLVGAGPGMVVADLCAAPGGKTAQLAAAGARVIAVDRSAERMRRLNDNLSRLRLTAECVVADAKSWQPPEPLDAVLLDAPCSATGIMRRQPDILRTRTGDQIGMLAGEQQALLRAALRMVKPGGRIVFATCSLEPEEGEAQIATLLREEAGVRIDPVDPQEIPGFGRALADDGTLRVLPTSLDLADDGAEPLPCSARGSDGFFVARLNKP